MSKAWTQDKTRKRTFRQKTNTSFQVLLPEDWNVVNHYAVTLCNCLLFTRKLHRISGLFKGS